MTGAKVCIRCDKSKELSEFQKNKQRGDGLQQYCKQCRAEYLAGYRAANPEKEEARRAKGRQQRIEAREKVMEHYGRLCRCCGESNPKFLTVEHINGGGRQHRKEIGASAISIWLVKNDFPEGFELLCYNCNCGKRVNDGVCPHEDEIG